MEDKSYRVTWLTILTGIGITGAFAVWAWNWWYVTGLVLGGAFLFAILAALGYDDDRNMRQQREEWKGYDDCTGDREWHRYDNADYWSGEQVD